MGPQRCHVSVSVSVSSTLLPLFTRLSSGFVRISASYDWYSSKLVSCSLLPAILLVERFDIELFSDFSAK